MTTLPISDKLPVEFLSTCFQNTTNSYKFYWFLAILEYIKTERTPVIPVNDLKSIMISSIWYPTVYFNLSFGKQDRLSLTATLLNVMENLEVNPDNKHLTDAISTLRKTSRDFAKEFNNLGRYVPYRFLEPFLRDALRGVQDHRKNGLIIDLAGASFTNSNAPTIYRFLEEVDKKIEIHPDWYNYLQRHLSILEEYCLWNLLKYLQLRNPNVPNIAGKLFPPKARNLENARKYWQQALHTLGQIQCIYSHEFIPVHGFSLDHFLPWRYVTHDLLWNIIPTLPAVNSSKGDRLPDLSSYFEDFSQMQFKALQIVATSNRSSLGLIEDYIILFGCEGRDDLIQIPYDAFQNKLRETLAPQLQIARSMGFIGNWSYSPHDLSITTEP
jgi:hypothetical protein